jgi:quercetin 2,3-dioxygenase
MKRNLRLAYVHVARGRICVDGRALSAGDGLKVTDTQALEFSQGADAEVLVFDLPQL